MIPAIVQGIHDAAGEVAGLVLVVAVVALLAWLGRRQDVRRAAARREERAAARQVEQPLPEWTPPPWDPAELGPQSDPWQDVDDDVARLTVLDLLDVRLAGAR